MLINVDTEWVGEEGGGRGGLPVYQAGRDSPERPVTK